MVMWMSRVERKKTENKVKRFFRVCMFLQIILLIFGLLAVDFQIRTTLGIDEVSLISYKQIDNSEYIVHIMGKSHSIDAPIKKVQIYHKFAQIKEMTYSIREWIKERFKNIIY